MGGEAERSGTMGHVRRVGSWKKILTGQQTPGTGTYTLCTENRCKTRRALQPCSTGVLTGERGTGHRETVCSLQEGLQGQVLKELLHVFWEGLDLS